MTRYLFVLAVVAAATAGACNKPSESECRDAISNMEKLLGTEAAARNVDNEGEVRRCRGGSSRAAVTCAGKAHSVDELKACAFMTPRNRSKGSAAPEMSPAPGSAAPATPPAAAPPATPPAPGSDAPPPAGSAAAPAGSGPPATSPPADPSAPK